MKNPLISGYEAQDITQQVSNLLRDIGNPEPPLSLDLVRDRLKLDRQYYSSTDHSFISDVAHTVKVAGKQILKRPTLLVDAIKKFDLRALWLPDSKRILIDGDLPKLKHRWAEGHEIGHSITPWHREFLMGDAESELSPSCFTTIEAEANYACGQLLFLQSRFIEEAMSLPPTIKSIHKLKEIFGNTYTSTLWRFVEEYRGPHAMVGIVTGHPINVSEDFDPSEPCRYVVQSPKFRKKFGVVSEVVLFECIRSYCNRRRGGPLGTGDVVLGDENGDRHEFQFESFHFHHQCLTLGIQVRKLPKTVVGISPRVSG